LLVEVCEVETLQKLEMGTVDFVGSKKILTVGGVPDPGVGLEVVEGVLDVFVPVPGVMVTLEMTRLPPAEVAEGTGVGLLDKLDARYGSEELVHPDPSAAPMRIAFSLLQRENFIISITYHAPMNWVEWHIRGKLQVHCLPQCSHHEILAHK
jgi:hypothetical protein